MNKKKTGIKTGRPISAKKAARKVTKGKGVIGIRKGADVISYVKTRPIKK